MDFIPRAINEYCETYSEAEDTVLAELHRATFQKILQPRMLSGHLQGQILSMIAKLVAPMRILEIGTYTGYSAICLAKGLQEGGELITIDINEELEDFAKSYFQKAGFEQTIQMKVGDALEIIPQLPGMFDLVFIDADKDNYSTYYDLVIDRMPKGGLIICDNVLWSGKVVEPIAPKDKETQALVEFAHKVQNDVRVENVLFPIRDGLYFLRKK